MTRAPIPRASPYQIENRRLRAENAELREFIDELHEQLSAANAAAVRMARQALLNIVRRADLSTTTAKVCGETTPQARRRIQNVENQPTMPA